MSSEHVLLTGATGYLGRHLCHRLLQLGYRVGVIVRPNGEAAEARMIAALAPLGPSPEALPGRLELFEGDVTLPDCGLDAATRGHLGRWGLTAVVHCAGLTRFDGHLRDAIERTNLAGTRHAHGLARALGARQFHQVSTAFVAGDSRETFWACDLERGQGFNNPYEASKFEAERYLRDAYRDGEVIRIHRPSIVVGGHPLGRNQSVSTVYTFLKALHFLRRCWERDPARLGRCGAGREGGDLQLPLRIEGHPQSSLNLVAIGQVVKAVVGAIERPVAGLVTRSVLGRDYTLERLRHEFCRAMGMTGVRFVGGAAPRQARTALEQTFHRATHSYRPYLQAAPRFPAAEKRGAWGIDPYRLARQFRSLLERDAAGPDGQRLGPLALEVLSVTGPEDYFNCLIDCRLGRSFLERIPYVDSRVRFLVDGRQRFDRTLHFHHGQVRYCDPNEAGFDFCYQLGQELFEAIIHGRKDIRQAFFVGQIRISGDLEAALKFGYLFNEHFRRLDERVLEEVCA